MTSTAVSPSGEIMRRINESIWQSLGAAGYADPIAFFCECDETGCYLPVWLTATEYEAVRDHPALALISPEHSSASARGDGGGALTVIDDLPRHREP